MTLAVKVVSPEAILFDGEAEMVVCRVMGEGDAAFLTGHAPFAGVLEAGTVRVLTPDGGEVAATIGGGFVEVSGNEVTVLSDDAVLVDAN